MSAIEKLKELGLSDMEIAIMSRLYSGTRPGDVADDLKINRKTVWNLTCSARKKIEIAGFKLEKPRPGPKINPIIMDPHYMDAVLDGSRKYETLSQDSARDHSESSDD